MSKKGRLPPAGDRNRPTKKRPPSMLKGWLAKFWKYLVGIITFCGVLSFFPLISIDAGSQLDSDNQFSIPFIVSNDGLIPLRNVQITCRFDNLAFEGDNRMISSTAGPELRQTWLAPHQKTTGMALTHTLQTASPV